MDMLTYRRPSRSKTEEQFIRKFIVPLDVKFDAFGNAYKVIGNSNIMWSCHTDTVHKSDGRQLVQNVNGYIGLHHKELVSNCLGADCTTGVFIMMEMIKAEIPGLYIFHREEEIGGNGSHWFAKVHTDLLEPIEIAIAFDRRATNSVITHQMSRCCSNEFAQSLANQLLDYRLDDGGVFTDTANYTEIIPECTNLSVGYYNEHSSSEVQDWDHIENLISLMISLDPTKLVIKRDPAKDNDYGDYMNWGMGSRFRDTDLWDDNYYDSFQRNSHKTKPKHSSLVELIIANPEAVADLLEQYGLTAEDLEGFLYAA